MKFLKIFLLLSILCFLIGITSAGLYDAPVEFGNDTDTTCFVGGSEGIVNCTGNATFGGNAEITGNASAVSGLFSWLGSLANRITKLWAVDIDASGSINVTGNINASGNISTSSYFEGQPLDGSIGSGIISADRFLVSCGCMNVTDDGGIQVTYPAHVHRIVHTDGSVNYCSISETPVNVTDNQHSVYYVDANCVIQSSTFSNYYDINIGPGNYSRMFDVYTDDGDIESLKAATLIELTNRKSRRLNVDCGSSGHLAICDGICVEENTFPYFNQTSGHFNYINTMVATTLEDVENDGLHFVYRSGGTWTHASGTGINLTDCDDGTNLVSCSPAPLYRRYFLGSIGWGANTKVHQLAAFNDQTFTNLGNCLDIIDNPLSDSYTIPPNDVGVFVLHHVYCGRASDSDWTGAWIDLRADNGLGGGTVDTSPFLLIDGSRVASTLNITSDMTIGGTLFGAIIKFLDWTNVTITESQISDFDDYVEDAGDTMTGSLTFDDGVGESPRIYFYNALDNESRIYEQTDGDLYIAAAKGLELVGSSFRMTTLTDCDTIDTDGTGVLSCGEDSSYNATYLAINTTSNIVFLVEGVLNSSSWNRSGTDVFLHHVGGNVGIGTNNPSALLDVQGGNFYLNVSRGNVYFEDNSLDNFDGAGVTLRTSSNPTNAGGSIFAVRSSGQATRLWVGQGHTSSGTNPFYVQSSSSTIANDTALYGTKIGGSVDSYFNMNGGNVGIGNFAPAYKLEIADVEKALNVSGILYVNGTSGKVGIGTDSPSAKLDVRGAIYSNDSMGGFYFTDRGNQSREWAWYSTADTAKLWWDSPATNFLAINGTSSNVGIGTDSPLDMLHIRPITYQNNQDGGIRISDTGDNWNFRIALKSNAIGESRFGFDTGNVADAMVILNAGDVGIGTSTPSYPLDVNGVIKGTVLLASATGAEGGEIQISNSTGDIFWHIDDVAAGLRFRQAGYANQLVLKKSSGNIGIGTSSPDFDLDIEGASSVERLYSTGADSTAALKLQNDAQVWDVEVAGGDTDKFRIEDVTGGTVPFRIEKATPTSTLYLDSTGVGIGTSSPKGKLEVIGSINATDWSNITIIESQVSDADWWDADGDIDADEISESKINFVTACAAGNHYYLNGNDLACEADDDTTYLGGNAITLVGTTFNFDGGASPAGDLGGTWANPSVDDDSHNHIYSNIDATTSANWATRVSDETGSGKWVFGTAPTITTSLTLSEDAWVGIGSGSERIIFDGTGGDISFIGANVGIGTSIPTHTLNLIGISNFTNNANNADSFIFHATSTAGLSGEKDVFIIQDDDVGGGGQDESSVLKVYRTGVFNAADDGSTLVELTYTGGSPQLNKHFYTLGRLANEAEVEWGVDLNNANIWTTGSIYGGATGTNCGGTGAACFNSPTFAFNSTSGNLGIGTSTPGELLEVAGNINSTGGDICISGGNCLSTSLTLATADTNYVSRDTWTDIDNYPAGCGGGQYVSAVGDTLTCSTPSAGGAGNYNWSCHGTNFIANIPAKDISFASGGVDVNENGVYLSAPVSLIDGAVVTAVECYGDAAASAETWSLRRLNHAVGTTTLATANFNTEDNTIVAATIDNALYFYNFGTSSLDIGDEIYGCRIEYTL